MQMDTRLLEAFRIVMENRSVTRTATILGLTQPAVSAQLARLEATVGFPLFSRSGRRLVPTAKGQDFYREVVHALGMIDRLAQISETIRTGAAGKLVVASHPSGSIAILPDLVARFATDHPEAAIRMISRTSEGVRSVFEAASVDIGIAELPIDLFATEVRKYVIDCVAIVPRDHPLAARGVIRASDLSGAPFIGMAQGRLIGHRIKSAFVESGAEFRATVESEYFASICRIVAAGTGVSVVDAWSAHTFLGHGLAARPFEPAIGYEIGVFYSTERERSELADRFLAMLDDKLKRNPFS